jgi:hypothetical protein
LPARLARRPLRRGHVRASPSFRLCGSRSSTTCPCPPGRALASRHRPTLEASSRSSHPPEHPWMRRCPKGISPQRRTRNSGST